MGTPTAEPFWGGGNNVTSPAGHMTALSDGVSSNKYLANRANGMDPARQRTQSLYSEMDKKEECHVGCSDWSRSCEIRL
jgi:hypothetical protein